MLDTKFVTEHGRNNSGIILDLYTVYSNIWIEKMRMLAE